MKVLLVLLSLCLSLSVYANKIGKSLNNGFVIATLKVVTKGEIKDVDWNKDTIYVLPSTPPEINPIAGVLTVDSGSMISHVQLLCRSLGIPNSSIEMTEYQDLLKLDGKKVVYAAYDGKPAIVKSISELTNEESLIYKKYKGLTIAKPVTLPPVDFSQRSIVSLDMLDSSDSGVIAGPKASNLGLLKKLFPDKVSDGFVIPFGVVAKIFKDKNINIQIKKLNQIKEIERVKKQLNLIRKLIAELKVPKNLLVSIQNSAKKLIDTNNGSGLFIRSDTNVEDLPQFSGAGLNKTVPNLLDINKLEDAIKLVWSSPWRERSHAWRTKYITNPETILPSILIMKSVDARRAGVMATMNFETGSFDDLFVSASEGLGFKVVDGLETPEQWLIWRKNPEDTFDDQLELINQAHAKTQYVLNNSDGGISEIPTTISDILNESHLKQLYNIVETIKEHSSFPIPFESEFGITEDGKVALFQVRQLVLMDSDQRKQAIRSFYEIQSY